MTVEEKVDLLAAITNQILRKAVDCGKNMYTPYGKCLECSFKNQCCTLHNMQG